ncbi:MAG: hypothetical protein JO002_16210 [Burkholderiaceae bacterium]|nr:hypothetical protein [Burkholderiaceae bacterium]
MADVAWSSWINFYSATASGAAALTGLVFVSLSINLTHVLSTPGMKARAAESIALLGLVLLVSLQSLIPNQTLETLGWEAGPAVLLAWVLPQLSQWHSVRRRHFRRVVHVVVHVVLHQASTLPMLCASFLLMHEHEDARYWLAGGILLTLVAGMISAWVLLVEIVQ